MPIVNALVGLATLVALVGGPIWLILRSRARYLEELQRQAPTSLDRLTRTLFDQAPVTYTDKTGGARVEGVRGGETFAIRVAFTRRANGHYMRTGYKTYASAEASVIMGLAGAQAKLSLVRRPDATSLDTEVAAAFRVDADPELLDDATKALISDLLARGPRVTAIRVDGEGLHVEWRRGLGSSGPSAENDDIALVMDFAKQLRARILEVVERRAVGDHVRVAYRDEPAEPLPSEEEDATADAHTIR